MNRWAWAEDRLELFRQGNEDWIARQPLNTVAQADQQYAAVATYLTEHGLDLNARTELLAAAVGTSLVFAVALGSYKDQPSALQNVDHVVSQALGALGALLPAADRSWTLIFDERPWTSNAQSSRRSRIDDVDRWRHAFHGLALEQKVPRLDRIAVEAQPIFRTRASMQDVAACHPATKAAIDGLVDARVVPNDTPTHVPVVSFLEPLVDPTRRRDALALTVTELPSRIEAP